MKKRITSLILALSFVLSTLGMFALPTYAKDKVDKYSVFGDYKAVRFYGSSRYETSISIAEAFWRSNYGDTYSKEYGYKTFYFDNVVIVNGANFPDALAGSYLAAKKNAPIIMVNTVGQELDTFIRSYISSYLSSEGTIYILGGTGAVSKNGEKALKNICKNNKRKIVRLDGESRFETNLSILSAATDKEEGLGEDLLVCNGWNYADALSASSVGKPILLIDQNSGKLTDAQIEFLKSNEFKNIYIIGGTSAVSKPIEKELKKIYKEASIKRLAGANRYETSVLVANEFFTNPKYAFVATGENFPDGLCGGPLAYSFKAPIILTNSNNYSLAANYVKDNNVKKIGVLGGTASLSNECIKGIMPTKTILDKNYSFSETGNFKNGAYIESVEDLINNAPLNPMKTNDAELDARVDKIFSKLFTPGMSTYDKLLIVYKYLVGNFTYGMATHTFDDYDNATAYVSGEDEDIVFDAKSLFENKYGVCNDFAAAFVVMARRLGFQCYRIGGQYAEGGHMWNVIIIDGQDYLFDSEADFRCTEREGYLTTYMFCRTERLDNYTTDYYAYYIHNFNGFILDKTNS